MQFKKTIFTLLVCTLVWSAPNKKIIKKKCISEPYKNKNTKPIETKEDIKIIKPTNNFQYITDEDFIITEFRGDYGLDEFLKNGGGTETDQMDYIFNLFGYNFTEILTPPSPQEEELMDDRFACSALYVPNDKGGYYLGRNYDMVPTKLLVLVNHPDHGYSSISSSDINNIAKTGLFTNEDMFKFYAIVLPVDGINEKGLSISLLALPTEPNTEQKDNNKSNISYVNAVRLILDKAADVNEAINLLKSMNYRNIIQNVHYIISDATGRSVAIEYYNNTMYVTETSVITNYYLSEKVDVDHNSINENDTRYNDLLKLYKQKQKMNYSELKDSMKVAFQDNGEGNVNTEWTCIYDTSNLEVTYYRKMDFQHGYRIKL